MANQILARLGVILGINVAEWESDVNKAIGVQLKLERETRRGMKAAAKEIEKLEEYWQDYGRTVTEVEKVQRLFAEGKKFQGATEEQKKKLLEFAAIQDKAMQNAGKQQEQFLKNGKLTSYQLAALSYQTTDIVTGLVGGQNPFLVLIQQGGQLKDQFGGVGNVFKAFASVLSPVKIAVGGLAAGIGALAYAYYQGYQEAEKFNNSLILTGNAAALTYEKYTELSKKLSQQGFVGIVDAKQIFSDLAASGQFTTKTIEGVATSIALVSRLSGQSASEVSSKLISAFNGSASSAKKLNEEYGFLTVKQYQLIETYERLGDKEAAITVLTDALNKKLAAQAPHLGTIAQLWNGIKNIWEDIKKIGAPATDEEILQRLEAQARQIEITGGGSKQDQQRLNSIQIEIEYQRKIIAGKKLQAEEEARIREETRKTIEMYQRTGGEGRTISDRYKLEEFNNNLLYQQKVAHLRGLERIAAETEKKINDVKNKYAEQNEKEGYARASFNEKLLQAEITKIKAEGAKKIADAEYEAAKPIKEKILAGQIEISQNKELIGLYQSKLYVNQGEVESLKQRWKLEEKIAEIERNVNLSRKAKDELVAREKSLYATKEQVDAQKKLVEKSNDLQKSERDRQIQVANSLDLEKKKLTIYQDNLFMTESEKQIAISRLETEQRIAAIRQKMADNPEFQGQQFIDVEIQMQRRREEIIGITERLQVLRDVNQSVFSNMETALTNFVKTGKLSFKDLARSIIQDILAIYMKAQMLQMFKGLGELFRGGGGVNPGGLDVSGRMGEAVMSFALTPKASGGYLDGPALVGENGPELFIPRTAGTIVPNQQLAGMTGGQQVVYNGPYIANMQAIDTQSATQFLAKNKQAVWSANQSASRSLPQSR